MDVALDYGRPLYPGYTATPEEHAEYQEEWDAWKVSAKYAEYCDRMDYLEARRDQFAYTGRHKGDKELLANLAPTPDQMELAA